jgi:hypothetical protein
VLDSAGFPFAPSCGTCVRPTGICEESELWVYKRKTIANPAPSFRDLVEFLSLHLLYII